MCVEVCPAGALSLDREGDGLRIDSNKCRSCFVCVDKCPTGALRKFGNPMSVEQAAAGIAKDEIFFFHSGGGVTISGGEPLSQARFTAAVLKDCNRLGIHTAIETCLFAPWGDVEMVLPWLDVMYSDIKIIDGALHKKLTGADNGLILENLRRIDASPYNIEIIARVPMIPGITDTDENLSETVRFLSSINKLKGIELLPYHRLGTDTYRHLGREYGLKGLVPPTRQRVSERRKYLTQLMKKYGMGG